MARCRVFPMFAAAGCCQVLAHGVGGVAGHRTGADAGPRCRTIESGIRAPTLLA